MYFLFSIILICNISQYCCFYCIFDQMNAALKCYFEKQEQQKIWHQTFEQW